MNSYERAVRLMKSSFLVILIAALAWITRTANADLISCDFSSETDATIQFIGTGDKIEFPNTSTYDFVITTATSPNLGGLKGNIGGTFFVGPITTIGVLEMASVTTTDGTFSVDDGAATLTADLEWTDIFVYQELIGGLNATGVSNLSNISYSGSNSDLLDIKNGSDQTVVLTFQFSPLTKNSLAELMTDGEVNSTSYSGSVSSVPEPSSCVLLGMGVLGLLARAWRRRAI